MPLTYRPLAGALCAACRRHMSRTFGQTIIIENIGDAGGTLGMTRAVQAKPDGYTIAVGNTGTQSAAPASIRASNTTRRKALRRSASSTSRRTGASMPRMQS
jgi:tripartite-type tricarboxylate transporter receptor subunit TctC